MKRRKLKPFVLPSIYSLIIIFITMSLFFLQQAKHPSKSDEAEPSFDYVIKTLFEDEMAVVGDKEIIVRPYLSDSVVIVKHFYDETATAERQENALIYHEHTYLQNSGVDYGGAGQFDVIAILGGTVIKAEENNLLGKIVEVRHDNDFISVYQCLSEVVVKVDDNLVQGEVIGKSGKCNIASDLEEHLHFEIIYQGQVKDPELFYEKTMAEL